MKTTTFLREFVFVTVFAPERCAMFNKKLIVCLIVLALAGSVYGWGPTDDVVITSFVDVRGVESGEVGISLLDYSTLTIESGGTLLADRLYSGYYSHLNDVIVNGGTFTCETLIYAGYQNDITMTQNGGLVQTPVLFIGRDAPGSVYEMNGGLLEINYLANPSGGVDPAATGFLAMPPQFTGYLHYSAQGTLTFSGGTIKIYEEDWSSGGYDIASQSWFNDLTATGASIFYGGGVTTITGVPHAAVEIVETFDTTIVNENDAAYEEGQSSDSFTVALLTAPGSDVTVTVDPADNNIKVNGAAAGSPVDLIFTAGDWDSPQTVTVSAVDDNLYEGDGTFKNRNKPHTAIINLSATSSDSNFNGLSQMFYVGVIDNDLYDGPLRSCDTKVVGFKYSGTDAFQYEKITHIIYAFVHIDGAGNISGPDLNSFAADAHKYGVKAIASIVGDFESMTDNNDGSRDAFIANAVQYLIDNNLDGIDYDWENDGFSSTERNNYSWLVRDTSVAFEPYGFTVCIDVVTWRNEIENWAIAYLDWLNLMGYDAGPPDHTSFQDHLDVISVWESRGAPREKLVAGTGFYGWKGNWLASYEYYIIMEAWNPGPEDNMIYLPDGNVGFCGINTTQQKMQHVIDNGYGGIMIWNLAHDTRDDSSLLKALDDVKDYYSVRCDSDFNDDKFVNLVDFSIFTGWWQNGTADMADLHEFTTDWLLDFSLREGFWKFDETSGSTAADSSGNSRDGTLVNMENADWVAGKYGNALEFDGVDEYVEITGYKGVIGSASRTVAAWIKTSTTGEIISWGMTGQGEKWIFRVQDDNGTAGTIRLEVGGGYVVGSTDLRDGGWHHVAAVLGGASADVLDVQLYVNGSPEIISASLGPKQVNTTSGADVKIGVFTGSDRYFTGQIDDVRIYSRGLSAAEIWELAN